MPLQDEMGIEAFFVKKALHCPVLECSSIQQAGRSVDQ
uniref:Uncharacterized protein n=1 Tax=Anguilla anguilla TaxID=7936 RepID=A0A0E9QLH7_ANGAN